jgi:hypothetical protein
MPAHGRRVVVVLVVVLVVVVLDVVEVVSVVDVVVVGQARQQLPLATAPPVVSHRAAERVIWHRSPPPPTGTRHAASAGLPHVERAAHLTTARLHALGRALPRTSSLAARVTHWTWLR